jgi:coenzyme F420 hydrogenase subunit beta
MKKRIVNVADVVRWRLCLGCGACTHSCPANNIQLVNITTEGIRPVVDSTHCQYCSQCLQVCPAFKVSHSSSNGQLNLISELRHGWGPILEVWEGHAVDSDIRYAGSSGGVVTALALFCLEKEKMAGVLHTSANPELPWENKTIFSTERSTLLAATGSRYSPSSPCDSLDRIEKAQAACVFVGKPCDVRALTKVRYMNKRLDEQIGVTIGIFCAGTPSTQATLDLLAAEEIAPERIAEIRYRGRGWPGTFTVRFRDEYDPGKSISYRKSWGFLQAYRPFCCNLCPDSTSEFADISCGDPWYRALQEEEVGSSLLLVRSEKGRSILQAAREAGYVQLDKIEANKVEKSQENLIRKRRSIWGRLLAIEAFGLPVTEMHGFYLFQNWKDADLEDKVRSILGTFKRIIRRRYYKPAAPLVK